MKPSSLKKVKESEIRAQREELEMRREELEKERERIREEVQTEFSEEKAIARCTRVLVEEHLLKLLQAQNYVTNCVSK